MKTLKSKHAMEWLNTVLKISIVSSLILFSASVFSSDTNITAINKSKAESTFQQGIKSFKQGHYQIAEQYFLKAEKQGYTALQINYNLGVATFKQKKYDSSISHFKKLVSQPNFTGIANYNIGLALERQGKTKEAQQYFKRAANDSKNEKIQYLAESKLDVQQLDNKQAAPIRKKKKKWSVYASLTAGYDDNVKLLARDIPTGQSDSYIQTYARARYDTDFGIRAYASIFDINYEDFDEENYRIVKTGIDYPFKLNEWLVTPALEYSESELGNNGSRNTLYGNAKTKKRDYQDITDYKLKGRKRFGKDTLTLLYRYSSIDAADNKYYYQEGHRQRIRADYRMPIEFGIWRFRYQFETNSRKDTLLRSYSPDRNVIEANFTHPMKDNWDIFAKAAYRYSDYPSKAGRSRSDNRYRYSIGTQYELNDTWSIDAKYEYTDNNSNQNIDDYTRNVYQLSLNARF